MKAIVLDEDQINDIGTTLRIVGGDENLAQAQDLIAGAQTTQARQNPEAIAETAITYEKMTLLDRAG